MRSGPPGGGDLGRLASALDTTPAALLGVGVASPPGQSRSQNAQPPEPLGADECRVFRTAASGGLAAASWQPEVSFEVDSLDDTLAEGWSILISGQAMIVSAPGELAELDRLDITPWAGGDRSCYITILPSEVSGRRAEREP